MHIRIGMKVTILATALCAALAITSVSTVAFAQNRGTSGLPPGPGNPMAALQQQIDALTQQIAALARLGQDYSTLQQQLDALQRQMSTLLAVQHQLDVLQLQMNALPAVQQQIDTLNNQITSLSNQLIGLSAQMASLGGSGGSGGLGVYDAGEKRMGDVVGVQDNLPWVSMKDGAGHLFVLQVLPGQLLGQFLWYSAAECSGDAFVSGFVLTNGPNVFSIAAVSEPGGVVYAAAAAAAPTRANVQSVRQRDGSCFTYSQPFPQTVLPAAPVITLDSLFKRPYSVH